VADGVQCLFGFVHKACGSVKLGVLIQH
jgi:hypothetical protein